jgi:hypothetical protein
MVIQLALLQALTNLALVPAADGLPPDWRLRRVRGAAAPEFAVTPDRTVRIASENAAGFATYRLARPLAPAAGQIAWRWRTATPLPGAELRKRATDDCPVRVYVVFDDGRIIFYSWGNAEARDAWFHSWTGSKRAVVVLRNAEDADGSWRAEGRDPFTDYRRVFGRTPSPVVAVGVAADTEQLARRTVAEVGELEWLADGGP